MHLEMKAGNIMNFRDKIIREASSFRENVIADVKDKASELAAFLNVSGEGEGPKVDENINDMIDGLVDMISKGTGGICDHIQSNSGFIEKMHAFIEEKNSEEQIIHLEVEKNLACIAILDMRMQTRLYNEVSKRKKEMLVTLGEFLTSIMDISAESNKAMTKKRWSFVSEMLKITEEKVTGLKEHESDENVGELIKSLIKDSVNSAKDQIDNYNLELDLFKKKYDEYLCNDDNEYVTSNLTCINSNGGSGCLCITKDQFESLNSRGSNK